MTSLASETMTVSAMDGSASLLNARVENFLDHIASERGFSANTAGAYRNDLKQFLGFLSQKGVSDWAIDSDTLHAFQVWLLERRYADTTLARKIAAVRS